MKVTEDAANRVLRSKVLCVINLVGLFPPDGLHAGDPGHMEDEGDFLTFLSDVRDCQNGVGPAEELVDALILENGIRSQPSDVLSAELEGNQNVLQLIEDSDGEIRNNEMFLRNCFGYAMYQFRNFLKLDSCKNKIIRTFLPKLGPESEYNVKIAHLRQPVSFQFSIRAGICSAAK